MAQAFSQAVSRLEAAGVQMSAIDLAGMLAAVDAASHVVMRYEAARVHEERFREFGSRLEQLADLVSAGLQTSTDEYQDAVGLIAEYKTQAAGMFRSTPIVLTPAATGPAPLGLQSTGDPRLNAPWTALGTPAISVPLPVAGLPLGLQLTADRGCDAALLRGAMLVEEILSAGSDPALAPS
jgi:Asp-tRNA(Asn)/Glu-tRNA(Gln) amidotransferase A subunit family amidase